MMELPWDRRLNPFTRGLSPHGRAQLYSIEGLSPFSGD
jgi:hypothetical protein